VSKQSTRSNEPPKDTKAHVVILIHGIRTKALWQDSIRKSLENEGFKVEPTNYDYYDVFAVSDTLATLHWWSCRGYHEANQTYENQEGANCSIIAHSFGTFIVSKILRKHTDLIFKKIIFCGSVVPHKFKFENYLGRYEEPLLNEVGTRDIWPAIAEAVTFGYGSTGTYGFRRVPVRDRWHNGAAHGDFLKKTLLPKILGTFSAKRRDQRR